MNLTRALEDPKKEVIVTKNEAWASFYTLFLSLTLNNASASLGGNGCLRTLNPKLPRTRCKFFERTCPVLQKNKIKRTGFHNWFLFM